MEFEIGALADGALGTINLRDRGIPEPDEYPYTPYTMVRTLGNRSGKGFGFPTASWIWDVIDQVALNALMRMFSGNSASVQVYIQTYKDTGWGTGAMLAKYKAWMHRPIDGSGKAIINSSRRPVWSDVTIRFTGLEDA